MLEEGAASEFLVDIPGVIHEFAACEILAVLEDLLQLQVVVLVLVGHGDHLPRLVQRVVLVHGIHVFLKRGKSSSAQP